MQSGETGARVVDPYELLFEGGQFYLVGYCHERGALRVFRLSRIRGKVAYATKAEHDFQRPDDFDPRAYANRIPWQLGEPRATAEIWVSDRIAWHVERNFGAYGSSSADDGGRVFRTPYAIARLCSPGRSATSRTRACSARPSCRRAAPPPRPGRRAAPRRAGRSVDAGRPPVHPDRPRAAARPREAGASVPSASPGWSRSPPC